jgi:SsrA-binding protein
VKGAGEKTVVTNRRARHEYHVEERFEAGLALAGTEVKSLRAGHASLGEAYGVVRAGEIWLVGASIEPYAQGNRSNHDVRRDRRLLLRKPEIARIQKRVDERGYTLVPLRLYFRDGRAKLELALARGKDFVDKRATLADRDARREIERALKQGDR